MGLEQSYANSLCFCGFRENCRKDSGAERLGVSAATSCWEQTRQGNGKGGCTKGPSEKRELQREWAVGPKGGPAAQGPASPLLPARGWAWLASVCSPPYAPGTHMLVPSPFQRVLAANPGSRTAVSPDSLPERQQDGRASLSPSTFPSPLSVLRYHT